MPKGYIYGEVEITDPAEYERYRPLAAASIAAFGGKYVVRGGDPKVLEGGQQARRVVLVEFDSREHALEFYNSKQYQEAKAIRERAAKTHLVILTGHDGV